MRTIIIGGGLAGLAAAYRLGGNTLLLEKDSELGGMAASYDIDNYHIEKYYHHLFAGDKELLGLINELGLRHKLEWLRSTTGYYANGKAYPMNTPIDLLRFPLLSIKDIIRLGWLVYKAGKIKDKVKLDNISAKGWVLRNAGSSVYENFFDPLLQSKFGANKERISAAWLVSRVHLRSNRGPGGERLGYLRGGFYSLIGSLAESIKKQGGEIRTKFKVSKIEIENKAVKGVAGEGEFLACDRLISTIGPSALARILEPGLLDLNLDLKYQGTACALLGLKSKILEDIYWLNIKGDVPFGAIIEHTNFLPLSEYGEHLMYIASYFQEPGDPLLRLPEEEVIELFLRGIKKLFPDFNRDDLKWWRLARDLETAPIYEKGYGARVIPYTTPIKGLYLAGMFSRPNYPERSMNGSIRAGFECADACKG